MTGPEEPGDDWAFPEVASPGPTSFELPAEDAEQAFDTGSDAWWRQQAEAQRRAAESEPVVPVTPPPVEPPPPPPVEPPPPPPVEAAVPVEPPPVEPPPVEPPPVEPPPPVVAAAVPPAPSPLDRDWLPADLPGLLPPEAPELREAPETETETEAEAEAAEPTAVVPPPARPTERLRPTVDDLPPALHVPLTRAPHEGERVGPARAVAGALLAVAGVGLGVGALLLYGNDEPRSGPVIDARPTVSASVTASPTAAPTTAPPATASATATASSAPTAVVVPPVQPAVAAKAPVDVLNNSRIKGLADRGAARFRAGGWPVPLSGNYRGGTISRTTIYFAPGQRPSAERFAKQFGIPRVLPRFAGLPGSGLTVVLTRDYR